jgi:outer membrane immunogenic protein
MKNLKVPLLLSAALLAAQPASAQNNFDGFRIDAGVGGTRFYSEGNNKTKLAVGASAGFDFALGDTLTVGPEVGIMFAKPENVTRDGAGVARRKAWEEYQVGGRIGFVASPSTLFYVRGAYVVNAQRKFFDSDAPGRDYYNKYNTQGYLVGGGVEQQLGSPLYVKAEGSYSNYRTNSSRITALISLGLRFGASDVLPPPPPPPPPAPVEVAPPPPATQTCPDGSVVLATDACPVPPPPPPPPPAEPVRG